ncbi:MAG TPA: hypothetical protein H9667_03215 [Firmicutes bacterium]|nr:hypothetical protein [Bacillota bacterium]
MGIMSLFSILFFIFTVILLFTQKSTGKLYIPFGCLTFLFVLLFAYMPNIQPLFQTLGIYILFSIFFFQIGFMTGISVLYYLKRSKRTTFILSLLAVLVLMVALLNIKGYIIYLYIPILLFAVIQQLATYSSGKPAYSFHKKYRDETGTKV